MRFEVGKTYQHSTGRRMTIIGRFKTYLWGECLIGESDDGELIPVGESEENVVNWHEQECPYKAESEEVSTQENLLQTLHALESENERMHDVLDKIRAEIEAIAINGQVDEHTAFIRTGEQVKKMALDVIDKYRKEQK